MASAPGCGSTFTLRIEAGLPGAALASRGREIAAAKPAARVAGPLAGRILLAEDGRDNQAVVTLFLRHAGLATTVAENGRVACEMARAARDAGAPFDVILMDMQMPELDGYGATARLRAEGFGVPIIALTAHAMAEDRARCLAAGCSDYMSKPIRREELIAAVARHLAAVAPE